VRIGVYAGVSTARQQERGPIGSQLEAVRAAAPDGAEVLEEFIDQGLLRRAARSPRA
jgi:DNA invertase Pin-like site-specific DNA recombinase